MTKTVIDVSELQQQILLWRAEGKKIAFVPTMGALHEGHLALVRQAKALADYVVVSIFVNPKQFGPKEDFAKYPRMLATDIDQLTQESTDLIFAPNANEIYPDGFQTYVDNDVASMQLCGHARPGHFRGVLTIVMKLFNLVRPDVALFGKKDYQQWYLIRKMVQDLAISVTVIGCETVRDDSGLALSSRNSYLSQEQRHEATALYQALSQAQLAYSQGERLVKKLLEAAKSPLEQTNFDLDYLELLQQQNLQPFNDVVNGPAVMLVAAKLGSVRLIDNLEFGGAPE